MLYYIWIPLLSARGLLSSYFAEDTILLTIVINLVLFLDLCFDIKINKYKIKIILLAIVGMTMIVLLNKSALSFFNILLGVYLLRNIPLSKLLNYLVFVSIFMLVLFSWLYFLEINKNEIAIMPKGIANSFGFKNTNATSAFFMIYLMVISLFLYNIKPILSIIILPIFYIVYQLTLFRTGFYSELIFYISIIIFSMSFFKNKFLFVYKHLPLILFALLIMLTYLSVSNPLIDIAFTGRFGIYYELLSSMNFNNFLYGLKIPEGKPMDCSYFALLFDGGIFYLFFFFLSYRYYVKYSLNKKKFRYFPFVLFMLAAGFSENIFSSFNILSVLMFKILLENYFISNKSRRKNDI